MLRRKMLMQALIFVVGQLVICTTALGGLINMTDAEQQVEAGIGYMSGGIDHTVEEQHVPDPPQGLGNADLNVSFAHYGVSLSATLESLFEEDQVTADGSATASAAWGEHPLDADDVHGGCCPRFLLYFTRGSSPAYLYINGQINIDIDGYPDHNPEETFVYVRLSSDDGGGMTTIWEDSSDGIGGDTSIAIGHGLWLEASQNYLLEALAESGTGATPTYPGLELRTASFSFTATITEGEPVEVAIDIKPGSYPNSINPNAGGVIPVAILSTTDFDASTVNPQTVALEGAGARGKGKSGRYGSMEDVDGDGDLDLVVQVVNEINWAENATEATLTGFTLDGILIEGTDSVNIVPPEQ